VDVGVGAGWAQANEAAASNKGMDLVLNMIKTTGRLPVHLAGRNRRSEGGEFTTGQTPVHDARRSAMCRALG